MTRAQPAESAATPEVTRHYILGTAGHIDHGKTLLVRALTGTDTDRLPEERRRGMTIELGFAELTIGQSRFGVVDVPGHERFIRTMVAGATGIDLALIVVAADDSVMPQTVEHAEILQLLGVERGVVAITKIDVVEPDMVELVVDDVTNLLEGSPMANAPICPVSSLTGAGLEQLKQAILGVATEIEPRPVERPFRMAIDRVFAVQGRGTVVTGSALRGTVNAGDTLEALPSGDSCRVRDLQTHGDHHDRLERGQRIALNLSGLSRERLRKGMELATTGYLQPSRIIDVRLQCLGSHGRPIKSTSVLRLGIGTVEVPVRIVLPEHRALEPGAWSYAQLRSGESITAAYGQRFIIRDENATRTIGGGTVLRPVARRKRRDLEAELAALRRLDTGDAPTRVEEVLRGAGFVRPTDLQVCARGGVEVAELPGVYDRLIAERRWVPLAGTESYVVPAALDDLTQRLSGWLQRYHQGHPEQPGRHVDSVVGWLERMAGKTLARPLFDRLIRDGIMKPFGRFICLPAFAPALTPADEKLMAAMLGEISDGGFQPPALDRMKIAGQADRKRWDRLATLAVAMGELVRIEGKMYLHADADRRLRATVAELIGKSGPVTVAQVREALDSSRKYVVPFLEYLDRTRFTRRVDDRRVLVSADEESRSTGT